MKVDEVVMENNFNKLEISDLMICAFRYVLGRRSYIVRVISDILIKHKDKLSEQAIHVIKRDILHAFEVNNYGMDMDKKVWEEVLSEFNK